MARCTCAYSRSFRLCRCIYKPKTSFLSAAWCSYIHSSNLRVILHKRTSAMSSIGQPSARTADGYLYSASGPSFKGLRTDAVVPSSQDSRSSYDAIVIGAGFAGLVAARDLALDRNLRVLLIEARDRIGGRTWTAKAFGEEFEMGGTFVHWWVCIQRAITLQLCWIYNLHVVTGASRISTQSYTVMA
jgi:hypothetical protein